ncbi:MAG: glycosyltransferase family 4 protein [Planctomycetales bacterium]
MLLDFVPNQERSFEAFLLRLASLLNRHGWQGVFVFSGEPSPAFAARLAQEQAQYRIVKFPLTQPQVEALIESLKGLTPRVMTNTFLSCFSPYFLQIKKRLRVPYWIVHDQSSGVASSKWGLKRLLAGLRGWYYGRHIDRVLAVSRFVAQRNIVGSHLPSERVRILHNGVDLERFYPADDESPARPVVVFVGQLIREKGAPTLLQALLLLRQRPAPLHPEVRIAGRGAMEPELKAFAVSQRLDNVKFLGQVADVPALFRSATVVVVPSEWPEAFGFVVAEAMACGACVLASDAGALPEVIGQDQSAGRLFRNGDAQDLARSLAELLENPALRQRYRQQALARARQHFALDGMASGFIEELNRLAPVR